MSAKSIKLYLSKLIINRYNIYYIDKENDNVKPLTSIDKINQWGTQNKLFYEKEGKIILNKKKLYALQKQNNIRVKIYKTSNTAYMSPVDNILDETISFEYKMDILVNGQIVYSMEIESSSFKTNNINDIKSSMFDTFNFISNKCVFVILYLLS
jgi:hypothetical protein